MADVAPADSGVDPQTASRDKAPPAEQTTSPTAADGQQKSKGATTRRPARRRSHSPPTKEQRRSPSPKRADVAFEPASATLPTESLLLELLRVTRKGAKKATLNFAACPSTALAADMLLLSRVVEGAPCITALDIGNTHFDAIATGQLSATLTASPHIRTLVNLETATFSDPTVKAVLEAQVDRNAALKSQYHTRRRLLRDEAKEQEAAQQQELKVVSRRLAFYARQRRDMEAAELRTRLCDFEQAAQRRWLTMQFECEADARLKVEHDLRDILQRKEDHARRERQARSDVENAHERGSNDINRTQEQELKELQRRCDEEGAKLHRREVEQARHERRQRDALGREEKNVRTRVRREEEDKRGAFNEDEQKRRRAIRDRIEDDRRKQREAEFAELVRQQMLRNEELARRETREQLLKDHRRERDVMDRDEGKGRDNVIADEKRCRKEQSHAAEVSFELARRATLYNDRDTERALAAQKPNSISLTGIPDDVPVVQGNAVTPICLRGSAVSVDYERPRYMRAMMDALTNQGTRSARNRDVNSILAQHGLDPLEAHEITNEEWCARKATFHGASIEAAMIGDNIPASDVMQLVLSFGHEENDFVVLNDAVLVRKSTGDQVGTVTKMPHAIRIVVEAPFSTLETLNGLLHSICLSCRARAYLECKMQLTVAGLFGVPTSTTARSGQKMQALGKKGRSTNRDARLTSQATETASTADGDGPLTPAAPPVLDETAFELNEQSVMDASMSLRRRPLGLTAQRVVAEQSVTRTFTAKLHKPVFVMGDLAVSRLVYAEHAGDLPVLTGLENFDVDMISWDGIMVSGDLGPLKDTSDAIVFGGRNGIAVEKHTISVDGSLLATIQTPGVLQYPSNKGPKELGMPTRFEILLRASATQEGLVALLKALCFRNDSSSPVSGTRHFRISVFIAEKMLHATTAIDVDVVQEDQPTVFDIGFSPVVCRSPHAVADELLPLVTSLDNPCYFAANSVVYDFDTADFSGGYLHLYVEYAEAESDPSSVSLRLVPYHGSLLQLQSPQGGTLFVDDVDIGNLTYLNSSAFIVRFGENASVNAVGVLLRNVIFSSNSDRGQTRIIHCVLVAGKGAPPVKTSFEVLLDDSIVQHASGMVRVPSGIAEPQPLGPFVLSSSHGQWDGGFLLMDFPASWSSEDNVTMVPGNGVSVQPLSQREITRLQADLAYLTQAGQPAASSASHRPSGRDKDKDTPPVGIVPERKGLNTKMFLRRKLPDKLRDVVTEKAKAHEEVRLRQLLALRKHYGLNFTESVLVQNSRAVFFDGLKVATMISSHAYMLLLFDGAKKASYSLTTLTPENAHGQVPQRAVGAVLSRLYFSGNLGVKAIRLSCCDGHPHLSVTALQVEIGCSDEVTQLVRPLSPRTFRCRSADDDEGFCLFGDVTLSNSVIKVFNGGVIEVGFSGNSQSSGDQLSILTVAQQIAKGIPLANRITLEPAVTQSSAMPVLARSDTGGESPGSHQLGEGSLNATLPPTGQTPCNNSIVGSQNVAGSTIGGSGSAETRGGGVGALLVGGRRVGIVTFDAPNAAGTSNIRIEFDKLADDVDVDDVTTHEEAAVRRDVVSLHTVQLVLNAVTYTNVAATVKAGSRVCHCTVGHLGAEGKLSLVLAVKAPILYTARPHMLPRLLAVEMDWTTLPMPPPSPPGQGGIRRKIILEDGPMSADASPTRNQQSDVRTERTEDGAAVNTVAEGEAGAARQQQGLQVEHFAVTSAESISTTPTTTPRVAALLVTEPTPTGAPLQAQRPSLPVGEEERKRPEEMGHAASSDGDSDGDDTTDQSLSLLLCPDALINVPHAAAPVKDGSITISVYRRHHAPQHEVVTVENEADEGPLSSLHSSRAQSPGGAESGLLRTPAVPGGRRRRRSFQAVAAASSFESSIVFSGGVDWSQMATLATLPQHAEALPPGASATQHSMSTSEEPQAAMDGDEQPPMDEPLSGNDLFIALDMAAQLTATSVVAGSFREQSLNRTNSRLGRTGVGRAPSLGESTTSSAAIAALSAGEEFFHVSEDGTLYVAKLASDSDDDASDDGGCNNTTRDTGREHDIRSTSSRTPPALHSVSPSSNRLKSPSTNPRSTPTPGATSQLLSVRNATPQPLTSPPTRRIDVTPAAAAAVSPSDNLVDMHGVSNNDDALTTSTRGPFEGYDMLYAGKLSTRPDGSLSVTFDYRSEMTIARLQRFLRRLKLVVRRDFARKMLKHFGVHVFYLEVSWVSREAAPDVMIIPVAAMPLHKTAATANFRSLVPKDASLAPPALTLVHIRKITAIGRQIRFATQRLSGRRREAEAQRRRQRHGAFASHIRFRHTTVPPPRSQRTERVRHQHRLGSHPSRGNRRGRERPCVLHHTVACVPNAHRSGQSSVQ
jgi:hypothetical protein